MAIDYSFLEGVAPQQAAPQDDMANVTLRIDADALLLCDGEHIDIELKAGVVKKTQLPVGEHLLEFLSEENPDAKVEKVVDFPVAGKSYLVMVSGLKEALAQFETKATVALGAKRVFRLIITGYENEMSAMMVVRNILGCSIAEARAKLAGLPAVVIESEDNARVEALAGQFAKGNVEVVVETRNGHGELVESDSYETAGTGGDFLLNTAEDYYKKGNYEEAVKWYTKAAEQGNADAQYKLGECYYEGKGVEKDRKEAVKWYTKATEQYRKAAEQGNADAQYKLGGCYNYGRGVEMDYEEAAKWYRKAAEQGNADAMYQLGECYGSLFIGGIFDKNESEKWYRKAAEQYRKAAEQGDADAMYKLGVCYFNGNGVEEDKEEAVKWYRKAAEQGNADAQYKLGECYEDGRGVEEDYEEALKWYRKAAEQWHARAKSKLKYVEEFEQYRKAAEQGNADAMRELGECYAVGRGVEEDKEEAVKWYTKAAEQGNADAQYKLGECYWKGDGVEKNKEEAVKWYRKAAEQGNADAQYKLGECYYEGEGVEKDKEEAVKWYRKAAEQGNYCAKSKLEEMEYFKQNLKAAEQGDVDAMYKLGECYWKGDGVEEDKEEAVKWYRKAAEQGHAHAMCELGECYYRGDGVEKDYEEVAKWYRKAAEQGNADAKEIFEQNAEYLAEWKERAEQGDLIAMQEIGRYYSCGMVGKIDDYEALKWYLKAAEHGWYFVSKDLEWLWRCAYDQATDEKINLYERILETIRN